MGNIIGASLVISAFGLTIYLMIHNEIESFKAKKIAFDNLKKESRFDFIDNNLIRCKNYTQLCNTEKLMDKFLIESDKKDTRYTEFKNFIRMKRFEFANKSTNLKIGEPCNN